MLVRNLSLITKDIPPPKGGPRGTRWQLVKTNSLTWEEVTFASKSEGKSCKGWKEAPCSRVLPQHSLWYLPNDSAAEEEQVVELAPLVFQELSKSAFFSHVSCLVPMLNVVISWLRPSPSTYAICMLLEKMNYFT